MEIKDCKKCTNLFFEKKVLGTGRANAPVFIIGEAPGEEEYEQGIPFVGASGKLLRQLISQGGLKPEDYYITNTIKCRPPNNATPTSQEIINCREFLIEEIKQGEPKVLIAVGKIAATSLLQTDPATFKITQKNCSFEYTLLKWKEEGKLVMRTFKVGIVLHPSFLLRKGAPIELMSKITAFFKKIKEEI